MARNPVGWFEAGSPWHKFSIGPYGFIAIAVDPDGNMFGLHSMK